MTVIRILFRHSDWPLTCKVIEFREEIRAWNRIAATWKRILTGRGRSVICCVLRKWESADDARYPEREGKTVNLRLYKDLWYWFTYCWTVVAKLWAGDSQGPVFDSLLLSSVPTLVVNQILTYSQRFWHCVVLWYGWRRSVGLIVWEMKFYIESRRRVCYVQ
jgi:hypothetical protein